MSQNPVPQCPACHVPLQPLGQVPVRTGGAAGAWHILFGEWVDAGEGVLALDLYRCSQCARLEFYDHDFSLPYH